MRLPRSRLAVAAVTITAASWAAAAPLATDDVALGVPAQTPATGVIEGVLSSPFARRYPAAVYLIGDSTQAPEPPAANPVMDQVNLSFTPHVLPVTVGSTIDFPNSDEIRHNVYTTKSSVCQFNLGTYPAGDTKTITCSNVGVVTLLCNVHAEMSGYIVNSPTSYFGVTDQDGRFTIEGVPAGVHSITFWHERLASQTLEVTVESNATTQVEFTGLRRK